MKIEEQVLSKKEKFIIWLISKLLGYNPFKELELAAQYYADRKWIKCYNQEDVPRKEFPREYVNIEFSFMDGYIKCLHDNNLRFKRGKIVEDIKEYSV